MKLQAARTANPGLAEEFLEAMEGKGGQSPAAIPRSPLDGGEGVEEGGGALAKLREDAARPGQVVEAALGEISALPVLDEVKAKAKGYLE